MHAFLMLMPKGSYVYLHFDMQFAACFGTPTQENALAWCIKSQVKLHVKTQVHTDPKPISK
jgi:hypothetical protein